jgi:hypothetical protein
LHILQEDITAFTKNQSGIKQSLTRLITTVKFPKGGQLMEKIIKSSAVETLYPNKFAEMRCQQDAVRTWQQRFLSLFVQQKISLKTIEYYPVTNMFFKHMNN